MKENSGKINGDIPFEVRYLNRNEIRENNSLLRDRLVNRMFSAVNMFQSMAVNRLTDGEICSQVYNIFIYEDLLENQFRKWSILIQIPKIGSPKRRMPNCTTVVQRANDLCEPKFD